MAAPKATTARLLAYLQSNRNGGITTEQARQRFNITNVSARISELRKAGFPIYLNERKTEAGRTIKVYRLGQATRQVVAAGNLVLADPYFGSLLAPEIEQNLARVK